jgi:hypothetical protein
MATADVTVTIMDLPEVRELVAEVKRLQGLPIITQCGECAHFNDHPNDVSGDGFCHHHEAVCNGLTIRDHEEPPGWCPMRGRPK